MANALNVTTLQILGAVQRYMGFGRDTAWGSLTDGQRGDVLECVQRGLRQFYAPPPLPGESSSHEWTFLRSNGTIDTEAVYTTGAIDYVTGTAVVGAATSWTTDGSWVGRVIKIKSDIREIAAVGSGTTITLDRALSADIPNDTDTTPYEIWALVYDLPADFGGLRGSISFYDGDGYIPLRLTNESNMRTLRSQSDTRKGVPEYAAMINKTVTSDTTSEQAYQLMVWPVPDAVYSLRYNYSVITDSLMEDASGNIAESDGNPAPRTGNVPVGGALHGDTIIASCLTVAEQLIDEFNNPGKMQARYIERLAASISLDRRSNMPDYFGYNGDNSDSQSFDPSRRNQPVTFNNTEYP